MKTNTFAFLLIVLFAISSCCVFAVKDVWADEDELLDFDNEFDTSSAYDQDFDALAEFEVNKNKKPKKCKLRIRNDEYPATQVCRHGTCTELCKKTGAIIEAKCRKSENDLTKRCYCYKGCDTPRGPSPPTSPPAVSPAAETSPAPSPSPVASPVYPPAPSPAPVATPASSPAPVPASPLDPPCDDDDDVRPKNPTSVEEFSDEDFDFIFS